jgi:purine nucleoside phosphorylase
MSQRRVGIIGGSGLYHIEGFTQQKWISPTQRSVHAGAQEANSYVQPSVFDILAGARPFFAERTLALG